MGPHPNQHQLSSKKLAPFRFRAKPSASPENSISAPSFSSFGENRFSPILDGGRRTRDVGRGTRVCSLQLLCHPVARKTCCIITHCSRLVKGVPNFGVPLGTPSLDGAPSRTRTGDPLIKRRNTCVSHINRDALLLTFQRVFQV